MTLPFSEFIDKGGRGALTSAAAAQVSNFGLWVNAIPDSDAIDENGQVSGVLYYDGIRAVKTDSTVPVFEDPDQIENPGGAEDPGETEDPGQAEDPALPDGADNGAGQSENDDSGMRAARTGDESEDWALMFVSGAASVILGVAVGRKRAKTRR